MTPEDVFEDCRDSEDEEDIFEDCPLADNCHVGLLSHRKLCQEREQSAGPRAADTCIRQDTRTGGEPRELHDLSLAYDQSSFGQRGEICNISASSDDRLQVSGTVPCVSENVTSPASVEQKTDSGGTPKHEVSVDSALGDSSADGSERTTTTDLSGQGSVVRSAGEAGHPERRAASDEKVDSAAVTGDLNAPKSDNEGVQMVCETVANVTRTVVECALGSDRDKSISGDAGHSEHYAHLSDSSETLRSPFFKNLEASRNASVSTDSRNVSKPTRSESSITQPLNPFSEEVHSSENVTNPLGETSTDPSERIAEDVRKIRLESAGEEVWSTHPSEPVGKEAWSEDESRCARQPSSSSEDSVVQELVARAPGSVSTLSADQEAADVGASVPETPSSDEELSARLARGGWDLLDRLSPPSGLASPQAEVKFSSESAARDLSESLAEAEGITEELAAQCSRLSGDDVSAPMDSAEEGATAGDEPEMVTDPDAVDEEALRQLDDAQTEPDREARRAQAAMLKEEGNRLFSEGMFDAARERYTAALRLCPLAAAGQRAVLFSNRAACRERALDEAGATADCSLALQLLPDYVKPLRRRAQLHYKQDKLDESLADWKRLLELEPSNAEARRAVATLPAQIDERNERLKAEMLSKLKDLGNMILRPFNLSTDNFQLEQNAEGGYSVKFQQQPPRS